MEVKKNLWSNEEKRDFYQPNVFQRDIKKSEMDLIIFHRHINRGTAYMDSLENVDNVAADTDDISDDNDEFLTEHNEVYVTCRRLNKYISNYSKKIDEMHENLNYSKNFYVVQCQNEYVKFHDSMENCNIIKYYLEKKMLNENDLYCEKKEALLSFDALKKNAIVEWLPPPLYKSITKCYELERENLSFDLDINMYAYKFIFERVGRYDPLYYNNNVYPGYINVEDSSVKIRLPKGCVVNYSNDDDKLARIIYLNKSITEKLNNLDESLNRSDDIRTICVMQREANDLSININKPEYICTSDVSGSEEFQRDSMYEFYSSSLENHSSDSSNINVEDIQVQDVSYDN